MILLQAISDTTSLTTSPDVNVWGLPGNVWATIAVIECGLLILFVFLREKQRGKGDSLKYQQIKDAKSNNVDMNDVMQSIYGSKSLYKELSSKCHPDLFVNTEKEGVANEIFQEISRNKRDYARLNELKQRAITELGIKI